MSTDKIQTIQAELTVTKKEYITPHYIRIYLTGERIPLFANTTIGVNNKVLVPPKGINKIHFPDFDYDKMEWILPEEHLRPKIRTYTHRGIDLEANEIWIDFVAHGEEGPASAWAIHAKKDDKLGVLMKNGKSELYRKTNWYLLAGDATAIPVLSAILEDLPATTKGICIIEVHDEKDEQKIETKADIEFIWLHNKTPQKSSELANIVKTIDLPNEDRFAYVAAEFSSVKEIRNYLRKEQQWTKEELYAYSYWKSGIAEDKSTTERQAEKSSIE